MNDLIKRLLKGEGKLNLLLLEAKEAVESYDCPDLKEFIDKELNGYRGLELPDYRKLKGEIIGDIRNPFGGIEQGVPIGLSSISSQIGIDMSIVNIYEGIGFIEENLSQLSSKTVNRPLPDGLVKSLNELVQYNNPGVVLLSAAHSFVKSGLQHIPVKVREELIKELQILKKQVPAKDVSERIRETSGGTIESSSEINVFVAYAWEDDEHNDKVISFVDFLRKEGFNATMDRMKSQKETAINFNKMMISSIEAADKVVVVLSPEYKRKADEFQGGVGMEYAIIIEDLKTKANKYIFTSFGSHELKQVTPTGLAGREILNLKKDQDESEFNGLFAKLHSKVTINFSEVGTTKTVVKSKKIPPFRL